MSAPLDINKSRHSAHNIQAHLIFVSKYRRKVFDGLAIQRLRELFAAQCKVLHAELVEMDGESDHVHLLVQYPPSLAISEIANRLKGVSSRTLRLERADLRRGYYKGVLWSPSYFAASCGGAPIAVIRQYIQQQETPH